MRGLDGNRTHQRRPRELAYATFLSALGPLLSEGVSCMSAVELADLAGVNDAGDGDADDADALEDVDDGLHFVTPSIT